MAAGDAFLSIDDAVRIFRVSRKTVKRLIDDGEIEGAVETDGEWSFPAASLAALGYGERLAPDTPDYPDERAPKPKRTAAAASDADDGDDDTAAGSPLVSRIGAALIGAALLLLLVAGVILAISGGDDETASTSDTSAATSTPGATSTPSSTAASTTQTTAEVTTTTAAAVTTTTAAETTTTAVPTTTTLATTTTTVPTPVPEPPPETVDPPPPGAAGSGRSITVAQGDNFWSLAQAELEQSLGSPPTTAQVASYWAQVLDANADNLVDPGNFDLIHVGQVIEMPPT